MANKGPKDKRYLEQRGRVWWVTVEVPPSLRDALPKRLKKSLATTDAAVARATRWTAVAELKQRIAEAKHGKQEHTSEQTIVAEALKYRRAREEADTKRDAHDPQSHSEQDTVELVISSIAEDIRGHPLAGSERRFSYEPKAQAKADLFFNVAMGKHTPIDELVDQWLKESSVTARTEAEYRRAVNRLKDWGIDALEKVNRKTAGKFVSYLAEPKLKGWTGDPKSVGKYVSALSSYWRWLERKGYVETNPWTNQAIPKKADYRSEESTEERSFSDGEVQRLFAGDAEQPLADLMALAALSGMRIDEVCRLRVRDCDEGVFKVRVGKSEAGRRQVPIHPALWATVERRTKSKAPEAYLLHEIAEPAKNRERSASISQRFTRYRRKVGVADSVKGRRRDRVNFHSFRRWFITKAEQAGQPPHVISSVVGHEEGRKGMTLGTYSGGPGIELMRQCVQSVQPVWLER